VTADRLIEVLYSIIVVLTARRFSLTRYTHKQPSLIRSFDVQLPVANLVLIISIFVFARQDKYIYCRMMP